LINKDNAL